MGKQLRTLLAVATAGAVMLVSGCSAATTNDTHSPKEIKDLLIKTVVEVTEQTSVDGWRPKYPEPEARACDNGAVRFSVRYITEPPPPEHDRVADANAVVTFLEGKGFSAQAKGKDDSKVVYARGPAIQSLAFSTGPGRYYVAATTTCVAGNITEYE